MCSCAYCVGGRPTWRVKATLNVLAELCPTHPAISAIGATPTARLKRAKNAERESAASFANSATVQRRRVRCDPRPTPTC